MLALDVNLQQGWRGEELLALVTLVELHVCTVHEKRRGGKNERETLGGWGVPGLGRGLTRSGHLTSARNLTPTLGVGQKVHSVFLHDVAFWPAQHTSEMCGKEHQTWIQNGWM